LSLAHEYVRKSCAGGIVPLAKIETRKPWSAPQRNQIMEAVHSAMRHALKIPERDRTIRFIEHQAENFQVPLDKSENYILVEITMFSGRSLEAKKSLYRSIVDNLGALGIQPLDVFIVLHEIPLENWGIRGGKPASEVDLGFNVNV
jgi:phenylpyruvate tautomerase PptA (4-oxalocrotonate tautomerase family)